VNTTGPQPCPFCGGTYELRGAPELDAFHSLPICKQFRDLDVLEFAIKAREARGIPLDNDN
jgi:hypothetical protein